MNRPRFPRIFIIVIDSLGIGEMADSAAFGDTGVNTLGHISESVEEFRIPNLQKLGMANLTPLRQVPPLPQPLGYRARLNERSSSKDTMTGHWEMMGVLTTKPFRTFTETGFPPELIAKLERRTGHKVIGNRSASGTVILDELGEEEIATGHMIVYTSADSVLQICGNEETFDLKELYRCCEIARELTMREEWRVGRVIARPYVGRKRGEFVRTANRHDYAVRPPRNVLSALKDAGFDVISVGKIEDIFAEKGITRSNHAAGNPACIEATLQAMEEDYEGLLFVNLVDFDSVYGHRRDVKGYAAALEAFDAAMPEIVKRMGPEDLLMLTADHGCDPVHSGTDHTREYIPIVAWGRNLAANVDLGVRDTYADISATVLDFFGIPNTLCGTSFLPLMRK